MTTFASKTKTAETDSAKLNGTLRKTNDLQADSIDMSAPFFAFPIQRKASCACGGGCPSCQAKSSNLSISQPNDASEIEADRVANKVMRSSANESVSNQSEPVSENITPIVQTKSESGVSVSNQLNSEIASSLGGGSNMNGNTQFFMESRFGANFSGVRIHTNSKAVKLSRELNAEAFTVGKDVFFNEGKYAPESDSGKRLLAHELTHTLQQNRMHAPSFPAAFIQRQTKSRFCSDDLVEKLNQEMHKQCDKPRRCSIQGDSCLTATQKVAAGNSCVRQRIELQQKCFRKGDLGYQEHMRKIAEYNETLLYCIEVMTIKCAAEAAARAALAAAAAAAALALKTAAQKAMRTAAGRAFVYATVAASVILLVSGKAEAKISLGGDSPLEALYKAMEQDGVSVPDEMKKLIESDPELKKMIEDSAKKGGSLSNAQKEMRKKYSDYISQHLSEFSKEELKVLLTSTEKMAENMPADVDIEAIKKAIKEKSNEKDGKGDSTGEADKASTGNIPDAKDKPPISDEKLDEKYPKLSTESKKKIKDSSAAALTVWEAYLTKRDSKGLEITDNLVNRFFSVIPANLTQEQSRKIIAGLTFKSGATTDEIFESLKKGVVTVEKESAGGGNAKDKIADKTKTTESRAEVIARLKKVAAATNFTGIGNDRYEMNLDEREYKKDEFSALLKGKTLEGIGYVGYVTLKVVSRKEKAKTITAKFVSTTLFVDAKGNVVDKSSDFATNQTLTLLSK